MYLLKLFLTFSCLTYCLCQFSLVKIHKPNRNSSGEPPRINSPNTIIRIQVGPKVKFTNESISSLSSKSTTEIPTDLSTSNLNDENTDLNNSNNNNESSPNLNKPIISVTESNRNQLANNESSRKSRFGFSSFTDKLKPNLPFENNNIEPTLPGFPDFSSIDKIKPKIPTPSDFTRLANETLSKTIKDIPIIGEIINIPNHFKINNLKGAIEHMTKYGHLEDAIDFEKPQDLLSLKNKFKRFQEYFNLKPTGLFDQSTLDLMNEPRCGMPDKETKFTKLVKNLNGLVRKKRYELNSDKYDTHNLTWSVFQFSKKALKNQNEKVLDVFEKAFEVWSNVTNLNFKFKPNTNTTDIVIGFYSKAHGNVHVEPPFDGPNGTLAHTSYPTEWDLHLDDDEAWSLYPKKKETDLFTVSIHEIGHKLGLKHTNINRACLYPIYNSKSTHLDQDDIKGIQSLYGVKHNEKESENKVVDKNATEKPDVEEEDNKAEENKPEKDNRPNENKPNENRPNENKPNENRPDENKPNENRPEGGNRPGTETSKKQAIRILDFNPKRNIFDRREYKELTSTPCSKLKIESSVCLRNNKCLVIANNDAYWMNNRLKLVRRRKERIDELFKGLEGKIDSIYRDNDLIHIIQGRNVTTYDSFYSEPVNRTTLDQHFPGLPKHVKNIHSVFKKLSTGVIYIYSGELYWRYTKAYGMESLPRLTFLWGLPGKVKSVLHFNNGRSVYIKNDHYWVFDESRNDLLSILPGNISELDICKNDNFNIFDQI